jgi:hypothetical protein
MEKDVEYPLQKRRKIVERRIDLKTCLCLIETRDKQCPLLVPY